MTRFPTTPYAEDGTDTHWSICQAQPLQAGRDVFADVKLDAGHDHGGFPASQTLACGRAAFEIDVAGGLVAERGQIGDGVATIGDHHRRSGVVRML